MLQLRGERARLLGHRSHAHAVVADRMARTPQAAMAMLRRTWDLVLAATQRHIADLAAVQFEQLIQTGGYSAWMLAFQLLFRRPL